MSDVEGFPSLESMQDTRDRLNSQFNWLRGVSTAGKGMKYVMGGLTLIDAGITIDHETPASVIGTVAAAALALTGHYAHQYSQQHLLHAELAATDAQRAIDIRTGNNPELNT